MANVILRSSNNYQEINFIYPQPIHTWYQLPQPKPTQPSQTQPTRKYPLCSFCCFIVFLGLGRERFLPLARYTHRSLLQSSALLAHASTVSLSSYLIPAGFLTTTVYSRLGLPSLRMVPYHSTPPPAQIAQEKPQ